MRFQLYIVGCAMMIYGTKKLVFEHSGNVDLLWKICVVAGAVVFVLAYVWERRPVSDGHRGTRYPDGEGWQDDIVRDGQPRPDDQGPMEAQLPRSVGPVPQTFRGGNVREIIGGILLLSIVVFLGVFCLDRSVKGFTDGRITVNKYLVGEHINNPLVTITRESDPFRYRVEVYGRGLLGGALLIGPIVFFLAQWVARRRMSESPDDAQREEEQLCWNCPHCGCQIAAPSQRQNTTIQCFDCENDVFLTPVE